MRDFEKWQAVGTCVVCALLGPLLLPAAGLAGTGEGIQPDSSVLVA